MTYSKEPYPQNKLNNYKLHLYKRNYVGFNLTCLGEQELNEETTKYIYKYFDAYIILHIVATRFFPLSVIALFASSFTKYLDLMENNSFYFECKTNETFDELFFYSSCPGYIALILETVSFFLWLNSQNSTYKCVELNLKVINNLEKVYILRIVAFGLCCFKVFICLIFSCVQLRSETLFYICIKIYNCCKKPKKNGETAELGITKEENQAALQSF